MTHRTAAQRRQARRHRRTPPRGPDLHAPSGWQIGLVDHGPPVGPDLRASSLAEVMDALAGLGGDLGWSDVADLVLPQFERVRPYHPALPDHVVTMVPPGVAIGLAIDLGPALAYVSAQMIEGWAMSVADVAARAVANLHARAAAIDPGQVVWGDVDHVTTGWLQTECGIGATLVLAPHELERILGQGPRLMIAPMRDLLITLPPGEVELATWLFAEVASQDPNHLQRLLFESDGATVASRAMTAEPPRYR